MATFSNLLSRKFHTVTLYENQIKIKICFVTVAFMHVEFFSIFCTLKIVDKPVQPWQRTLVHATCT